jgi:hypothetical protein
MSPNLVKRPVVALLLAAGLLVLSACSSDDDDGDDSATGVAAVDAAVTAIVAGDGAALAQQAVFSTVACTTADGLGGPPKCADGETEGTEISALPAASCEGYYLREPEIGPSADAFVAGEPTVHGVYRQGGLRDFISGDYVVLLEVDDPQAGMKTGREVYLNENGITGLFFGCGQTVDDLIEAHGLSDRLE